MYLNDPITVVGDIHGQFYDMMGMLELGKQNGGFGDRKYLFLGDYVDRGTWAIEVLIYLYSLKINYPKNIFLLRGNHETRECTQSYNFKQEVLHKHDQEIYDLVLDSFDCLPLAAVLNGDYFCVHAGISPAFQKASDIENIDRFKEVPKNGPACDMVWSDPTDNSSGFARSRFQFNEKRNCSVIYGRNEVASFLQKSKLKCIIRAHEVQIEGYKEHFWDGKSTPMVITLFSAPNYCGSYRNQGAVMQFHNGKYEMRQYGWSDAPWCLPNFNDIWNWSMPFIIQKVVGMFYHVMELTNYAEEDELTPEEDARFEAMFARGELDSLLSKDQSSSHRVSILRSFQKMNTMASESDDVFKSIELNGKKIRNEHLEGLDFPALFKRMSQEDESNEKRCADINCVDPGHGVTKKSEWILPSSKDEVLDAGHGTDGFGRSFFAGNREPPVNVGKETPVQTGDVDALRRHEEKTAQQKYQRPQKPQEPYISEPKRIVITSSTDSNDAHAQAYRSQGVPQVGDPGGNRIYRSVHPSANAGPQGDQRQPIFSPTHTGGSHGQPIRTTGASGLQSRVAYDRNSEPNVPNRSNYQGFSNGRQGSEPHQTPPNIYSNLRKTEPSQYSSNVRPGTGDYHNTRTTVPARPNPWTNPQKPAPPQIQRQPAQGQRHANQVPHTTGQPTNSRAAESPLNRYRG